MPSRDLENAYPYLEEAVNELGVFMEYSAEQRQAFWASCTKKQLIHLFIVFGELRAFYENLVRPSINAEAQDRFISRGEDMSTELRAHASEAPGRQAILAEARQHTELMRPPAEWRKSLDEAIKSHADAAEEYRETCEQLELDAKMARRIEDEVRTMVTGAPRELRTRARYIANGLRVDRIAKAFVEQQ